MSTYTDLAPPEFTTFSAVYHTNDAMIGGFPGGSVVKKKKIELPMQESRVQSLGQEDPLEKEMATHSSILGWEIPRTEEPGELQSVESQKSQT